MAVRSVVELVCAAVEAAQILITFLVRRTIGIRHLDVVFAAVAAIVVLRVTYSRIFTAALFIVAGAAIAVVWLAGASRLPWFRNCLATAVVLALGGAGIYFVAFPDSNPHQTMQAIAPALNFELESPAMVPWCSAYTVSTDGALPHGYQVLMFDSSAGQQGDPVGLFTFDGAATAVPRTHDEWTVKDVFIGDKYRKDKKRQLPDTRR